MTPKAEIIYNVTNKLDPSIEESWLDWMKNEHIPEIIATGCFFDAILVRLLETDDSDGPTYAIQYHTTSEVLYNDYIKKFSGELRKKAMEKWGNKFIAFRSVMKVVH